MGFSIIAAADKKFGIGIHNEMPWHLKGDLKYFSDVTSRAAAGKINAVIMGRRTWESLPAKHRPLKGRLNVVLSRGGYVLVEGKGNMELTETSEDTMVPWTCGSLEEALRKLKNNERIDKIFVIGGANLFTQAILQPDCEKIYLTEVMAEFDCDAFFPKIPQGFDVASRSAEREEGGIKYSFVVYERVNP